MGAMDRVIAFTRKSANDYIALRNMTPLDIVYNYRSVLLNG
jgi:hypothetical protein